MMRGSEAKMSDEARIANNIDRMSAPPLHPRLLGPHAVPLLAADLLPLAGILLWHWDAFLLLMLYWMETAIVAFWALARLAAWDSSSGAQPRAAATRLLRGGLVAFFSLHAGLFMAVHFVFLWFLFSGGWSQRIHGPSDFIAQIVVAAGLWLPLLLMFVAGGLTFVRTVVRPGWPTRLLARLKIAPPAPLAADGIQPALSGLYRRIMIMQLSIIVGAWISLALQGSMAPFIVMIIARTIADLRWPEPYGRQPAVIATT